MKNFKTQSRDFVTGLANFFVIIFLMFPLDGSSPLPGRTYFAFDLQMALQMAVDLAGKSKKRGQM